MAKFFLSLFMLVIILLLAVNAYFLYLNLEEKPSLPSPSGQTSSMPQAPPALSLEGSGKSIGTQAGETFKDLSSKSEESYQVVNEQAQKTSQELSKTTSEALTTLNDQAQKLSKDLNATAQKVLEQINREIQKFQETLKKAPKTS